MQLLREYQLKHFVLHLVGLILADAGFQREQVLVADFVCFRQHLPSSVLAGRFGAKHCESVCRKHGVMVLDYSGEDKIGPCLVFCDLPLRIGKSVPVEYFRKVVLECEANS